MEFRPSAVTFSKTDEASDQYRGNRIRQLETYNLQAPPVPEV